MIKYEKVAEQIALRFTSQELDCALGSIIQLLKQNNPDLDVDEFRKFVLLKKEEMNYVDYHCRR